MTTTKSQIAFDVTLPAGSDKSLYAGREAWEQTEGVTHYDAGTVVCAEDDADAVEKRLTDAGFAPSNRRPIRAVRGTSDDVLHELGSRFFPAE